MSIKKIALGASALILSTSVNAATVFSLSETVVSVDRSATFDSLTRNGIDLSNYVEDSLFITVASENFQRVSAFAPGDPRITAFHYGSGGNFSFVSISGAGNEVFSSLDFLLGNGQPTTDTNIRWETYLNGVLISAGLASGVQKGQVVGWSDSNGFDELRVAASSFDALPGFGNFQAIAIDDLRAQFAVSAVPVPAAVWLFGSGLLGLVGVARRKI